MCGAADAAPRCPRVAGPPSQEPRFMQGASISEHRQLIKNGNGAWALRSLCSWRPCGGAVLTAPRGARTAEGKAAPCVTGGRGHQGRPPRTGLTAYDAGGKVTSLWTGPSGSQDTVPSVLTLASWGQLRAFLRSRAVVQPRLCRPSPAQRAWERSPDTGPSRRLTRTSSAPGALTSPQVLSGFSGNLGSAPNAALGRRTGRSGCS